MFRALKDLRKPAGNTEIVLVNTKLDVSDAQVLRPSICKNLEEEEGNGHALVLWCGQGEKSSPEYLWRKTQSVSHNYFHFSINTPSM